MDETGWDGQDIDNRNATVIIKQDKKTLESYGLSGDFGACVFLSTVDGTAIVLGKALTTEQKAAVYKAAKSNGAIGSGDMDYYVNDYTLLGKTVAAVVKGLPADTPQQVKASAEIAGAGNLKIPISGKKIDMTNTASAKDATKDIIKTLNKGGAIDIQYSPGDGSKYNHTMSVNGSHIENGTIILHLSDTLNPDKKTYVNTSNMNLYSIVKNKDGKEEKVRSNRPILNYRTISNNGDKKNEN